MILRVGRSYELPGTPREVTLGDGGPIALGGDARLTLSVKLRYLVTEAPPGRARWRVGTVAYQYTFAVQDGPEVLAYHWHPDGPTEGGRRVTIPHLHVGPGAAEGRLRPDIAGAHLPTGHVSLPELIYFAIDELGIRPIRSDWTNVLRGIRDLRDG